MNSAYYCFKTFTLLLITSIISIATFADSETAGDGQHWQFTIGAMTVMQQPVWKGPDIQFSTLPPLEAQKGNWTVGGNSLLQYQYPISEVIAVYSSVGYRDDSYDGGLFSYPENKNSIFDGYSSPDGFTTLTIGAQIGWVNLGYIHSLWSDTEANIVTAGIEMPVYQLKDRLAISTSTELEYLDRKYVRTLYGISAAQADPTVGRDVYHPDSAINLSIGAKLSYQITHSWGLMTLVKHTFLNEQISDSPLVDKDQQSQLAFGLLYQF